MRKKNAIFGKRNPSEETTALKTFPQQKYGAFIKIKETYLDHHPPHQACIALLNNLKLSSKLPKLNVAPYTASQCLRTIAHSLHSVFDGSLKEMTCYVQTLGRRLGKYSFPADVKAHFKKNHDQGLSFSGMEKCPFDPFHNFFSRIVRYE